jgi:hypothetical protein
MLKGTLDVPGVSRGGSFESYIQGPNKAYSLIQAHPFGTLKIGYNGRTGWSQTNGVVRPVKIPAEIGSLQRDADLYAVLRIRNNYVKVTAPGMSEIGYRQVYVLDLQPAAGAIERVYLDAQTYLPARLNTYRKLGNALEMVEVYLDDWKAVDGVQYPFSISQRFSKITLSFTVTEIRHNLPLDATLFEPPSK